MLFLIPSHLSTVGEVIPRVDGGGRRPWGGGLGSTETSSEMGDAGLQTYPPDIHDT